MVRLNRRLGFNLMEWVYIVFVAYTGFLIGSFNVARSPEEGLAGAASALLAPILYTALIGLGPIFMFRAGVHLVSRANEESGAD
ncbi:MAG: hypothetical protein JRG76_03925 [Deltaproteobacteria bacterium]|nr:hypothetical protein [Deltaproteobacteria bacterium]MBW2413637.1 hypothetical protein [Deltaproteobacteria bacterium]